MATRRILPIFLAATLAVLAAAPARADVVSTFDKDADGWQLTAKHDADTKLEHAPAGGNPGGRLVLTDAGAGVSDAFQAPGKFLGDDSGYYGGKLSFEILADGSIDDLADPVTWMDAEGNTLTHGLPNFAPGRYITFEFTLNPAGGWLYTSARRGAAVPPTEAQFRAVLGHARGLRIPGDFHSGTETVSLDNVILAALPVARRASLAWLLLVVLVLGALAAVLIVRQARRREYGA